MGIYKLLIVFFVLFCTAKAELKKSTSFVEGRMVRDGLDSFYDKGVDYAKFSARVTDKSEGGHVLKLYSENGNVKFFRAGDYVKFKGLKGENYCKGNVRGVENHYFVIYVKDMDQCFKEGSYFRRGTILSFDTMALSKRIREASLYRVNLLKRKQSFFQQLNRTNHFLWSFDQQKLLLSAEYDEKVMEIKKQKEKALDLLLSKKQDEIVLQRELKVRLDGLEKELTEYRIENDELLVDRWEYDHDLGRPVGHRPQEVRNERSNVKDY